MAHVEVRYRANYTTPANEATKLIYNEYGPADRLEVYEDVEDYVIMDGFLCITLNGAINYKKCIPLDLLFSVIGHD